MSNLYIPFFYYPLNIWNELTEIVLCLFLLIQLKIQFQGQFQVIDCPLLIMSQLSVSICPSVYLSIYLSLFLSIYLFIETWSHYVSLMILELSM